MSKNSFSTLATKLLSGQTLTILAIIAVLVIFHIPVEKLISETIVKYLLTYCDRNWLNDVIFIIAAVVVILLAYLNRKRFIANNTIFILLTICAFYSIYRFSRSTWEFTSFQIISSLKYADLVLLCGFVTLLNWSRQLKKHPAQKASIPTFFDDESLSNSKEDKLGYSVYAKTIASKIEGYNQNKSFAIGVNGKWGMGKTSFFDLIKRELDKDNNIIVDFNAWNNSSPRAIIQDFFNTLQEALNPYYSSLAHQLAIYSDKLVTVNDNSITQSLKAVLGFFTGDTSLNSIHGQINQKLEKVDQKIIIFIDDLDRLDKQEIIEVFRLIRNTANFRKTIFLTAYDRDYALKAVSEYNPYNYEFFLEKIFHLEINLPYFESSIFKTTLLENLKSFLSKEYHEELEHAIFHQPHKAGVYFNDWLTSMRDVTRLTNSISTTLSQLQGEVLLSDFLYLEMLRVKFPSIYEELSRNPYAYLESKEYKDYKYKFELKEKDGLFDFLSKNKDRFSVTDDSIIKINNLLKVVFPHDRYHYIKQEFLSVVFPSNFSTYFTYRITSSKLSNIEFTKARHLSQELFKNKIAEWVNLGLEKETKEKFENIRDFDDKDDFEKVITAIFFLANLESKYRNTYSYSNNISFSLVILSDMLYNSDGRLANKYYDRLESFTSFLEIILLKAKQPFIFESELVKHWLSSFTGTSPLPKDVLKPIAVNFFREYCKSIKRLTREDNHFWRLFHCCKYKEFILEGSGSYRTEEHFIQEAKEIAKEFIAHKDLDGFLFVVTELEHRDQITFTVNKAVLLIWDSWNDFEEFLLTGEFLGSRYLNEFLSFFQSSKESDFKYIPFNFEVIPVEEKRRKE